MIEGLKSRIMPNGISPCTFLPMYREVAKGPFNIFERIDSIAGGEYFLIDGVKVDAKTFWWCVEENAVEQARMCAG